MIFNIAFNRTSTIQSFFSNSVEPITVEPLQAVDITSIHGDTSDILQPINSFLNFLNIKKIKRFYLHRTFALGDILMLVPVVRELRKQGYDPYIRGANWIKPVLDLMNIETDVVEFNHHPKENEYGIMLDGIVEQDHMRPKLSELHRVDIYFKALGIQKMPRRLDWSMNLQKLPKIDTKDDYIVFQAAGSTSKKQLSLDTKHFVMEAFKEAGIRVIQISEGNKMSIGKLFATLANAKCLVTMDSSPLWISHFTKTPIIVLFGPTRPSERLVYHPLWPKKAIGIRLNEYMNPPCKSCFENARRCNNGIDCLKISGKRLYELIYTHVSKFYEK